MKTQNSTEEQYQLDQYFTAYRKRPGLLAEVEARSLLNRDVQLRKSKIRSSFRTTIMTTFGVIALGLLTYFTIGQQHSLIATTSKPSHPTQAQLSAARPLVPEPSNLPAVEAVKHVPTASHSAKGRATESREFKLDVRQYVELPNSMLRLFGMHHSSDSVLDCYVRSGKYEIDRISIMPHGAMLTGTVKESEVPEGVVVSDSYPTFATNGEGRKYFYQSLTNTNENHQYILRTYDDNEEDRYARILSALKTGTPIPGLHLLGYSTSMSKHDGVRHDTITVELGKDVPALPHTQPVVSPIAQYPLAVQELVTDLTSQALKGHSIPLTDASDSVAIRIQVKTVQSMIDELDKESNSEYNLQARSASASIRELIPIVVRPIDGDLKVLGKDDYVFWYRPTDALLKILQEENAVRYVDYFTAGIANGEYNKSASPEVAIYPNTRDSLNIAITLDTAAFVVVSICGLAGRSATTFAALAAKGLNTFVRSVASLDAGIYFVSVVNTSNAQSTLLRYWKDSKATETPIDNSMSVVDYSHKGGGMPAVHFVELNAEELGKIGVKDSGSAVTFYQGEVTQGGKGIVMKHSMMRSMGVDFSFSNTVPAGVEPQHFQPTIVTDGIGRKRMYSTSTDDPIPGQVIASPEIEAKIFKEINTLIPVLIRAHQHSDTLGFNDLVFWYRPTEEFLSELPKDVAENIREGYSAQDSLVPKNTASISGGVKVELGAIEGATIYPNPARSNLSVRLTLTEPRTLDFVVRDLLGHEVLAVREKQLTSGMDQPIDISHLVEGVYILDITSPQGERFAQRLIIER